MSATDNLSAHGRTRLSFASEADIDEFVATLQRYERGEMTPDQWRAFRLVRGTYGQRQTADVQMRRSKIPQGIVTSDQLAALADVGERYSRRFGHITTRQNVQFHFVKLHDAESAMRRLAEAGLTTREACGNSVRNITGCPYAGVSADERFDVSPYAEGLTRFLLRHPLSSTLPRKFKIAFEGCAIDHVMIGINDLGFRAQLGPDGGGGRRRARPWVRAGPDAAGRSRASVGRRCARALAVDERPPAETVRLRHGDGDGAAGRSDERADARPRRARARLRRRQRARDHRSGSVVPMDRFVQRAAALSSARGGGAGTRRPRDDRGCRQLPGRGIVPSGRHAVARPRPA